MNSNQTGLVAASERQVEAEVLDAVLSSTDLANLLAGAASAPRPRFVAEGTQA